MLLRVGLLLPALALGCSAADDRPSPYDVPDRPASEASGSRADTAAPCEAGSARSCKVVLPEHDGIRTCYVGVRLCVAGSWSECGEEEALWAKYFAEP